MDEIITCNDPMEKPMLMHKKLGLDACYRCGVQADASQNPPSLFLNPVEGLVKIPLARGDEQVTFLDQIQASRKAKLSRDLNQVVNIKLNCVSFMIIYILL